MIKGKLKPVGLSVAAAALTAVAFAAVSVAKDDGPREESGGPMAFFHERLSEEDREALEDFRQCMEDNGAPAPPKPPDPGELERHKLPEPPSEAEREAIEKALDACEDKLPEGLPHPRHGGPCGPPPGPDGEGVVLPAPGPPPSVVEPEGLKRS